MRCVVYIGNRQSENKTPSIGCAPGETESSPDEGKNSVLKTQSKSLWEGFPLQSVPKPVLSTPLESLTDREYAHRVQ